MNCKRILKPLVPPIMLNLFHRLNQANSVSFSGVYDRWSNAANNAKGYDSDQILRHAIAQTNLVVSGKASYERDGSIFHDNDYPFQLLATLLRAATENDNKLSVLDFGGALGSTYFQCQKFLHGINQLNWSIVEQKNFVEAGKKHFSDDVLNFHYTIAECLKTREVDIVVFSGVLQYLPAPFVILKEIIDCKPEYIVIDRTPFAENDEKVLSLQKVPKKIVDSSYPVWLFSESQLKGFFHDYVEVTTFDALDGTIGFGRLKADFKGIIYKKLNEKGDV